MTGIFAQVFALLENVLGPLFDILTQILGIFGVSA